MKIYIPSFNNVNLLKKMEILKTKFKFCETKETIMIYSEEGIYEIDSNTIFKYNIMSDSSSRENFILGEDEKYEFLIDRSEINKIPISYIPFWHNTIKITNNSFVIDNQYKKYQIKLVIESIFHDLTNSNDTYFYFEVSDNIDLNNKLFKDDINVFLSHLN